VWSVGDHGALEVTLPERLPVAAAHALELTGTARSTATH
jgi:hypothetical protein